jgi:hypothetical protein
VTTKSFKDGTNETPFAFGNPSPRTRAPSRANISAQAWPIPPVAVRRAHGFSVCPSSTLQILTAGDHAACNLEQLQINLVEWGLVVKAEVQGLTSVQRTTDSTEPTVKAEPSQRNRAKPIPICSVETAEISDNALSPVICSIHSGVLIGVWEGRCSYNVAGIRHLITRDETLTNAGVHGSVGRAGLVRKAGDIRPFATIAMGARQCQVRFCGLAAVLLGTCID